MAKKQLSNREKKLAAIRKADIDRDSEFDNLTFEKGIGTIKTRERVGQYKRDREGARDTSGSKIKRGSQTETYKKSDDSSETFDRLESGADKQTRSKIKQRSLDRESLRDARKERRATRIADRKGMSVSQAQDFMNNRRDRLNAAMGEFGKGLFGREQDLGRIKDREYRKRGRGTRSEDYKPFADSNTRTKSTYYDGVIKPAKRIPLNPNISGDMSGLSSIPAREEKEKKTKKKIIENLEPNTAVNFHKDVDSSNQMNPVVDTIGLPNNSFLTNTKFQENKINTLKDFQSRPNVDKNGLSDYVNQTLNEINLSNYKNNLKKANNIRGIRGKMGG